MKKFKKQPNDVLDYDVDMATWFSSIPTDNIARVEISIRSDSEAVPTLTAGTTVHPSHVLLGANPVAFKIWFGGGASYTDYVVTCIVFTEQDRQKEVEFTVRVVDL